MATIYKPIIAKIDSTANWTTLNPTPAYGEQCIEILGGGLFKLKVGDGVTPWISLKYFQETFTGDIRDLITPDKTTLVAGINSVQREIDDLATVAKTGDYNDLNNKLTPGTAIEIDENNVISAKDATTTRRGIIRIATDVEAAEGTDLTLAINPFQLANEIKKAQLEALVYKGTWNITNATDYSAIIVPAKKGDMYLVTGTGPKTIEGIEWDASDYLIVNKSVASGQVTVNDVDKVDNSEATDIVRLNTVQTLTNKTINADNNTISELETDNFKSGVIVTEVGSTGTDTSLPTEQAVREALNTKVDKTNEANQVYVTDGSGNQAHYTLSTNALNNTFAYRSSNAQVRVNLTPSGDNDATSKKYVNDQDALKVDKVSTASQVYSTDSNGDQTTLTYDMENHSNTIAQRTGAGQILVSDPTEYYHAATKNYVDNQDNLKVDKVNDPLKIYGTDDQGNQFAYNKEEVGQIIQVEELPIADATNINKIYQYIGETNQNYTNGVFYKNVAMTTTEQWVSFEPSTIAGTVCTCSYEDFRAWLDTIFALDPLEVASGHFGFYSGTPDTGDARYSIGLRDAEGHSLKSISAEVSELEAAGFTFNPYLSAQDGLDYTCAVDKQVTSYTWTPIYVQKKNIIFVDWGE